VRAHLPESSDCSRTARPSCRIAASRSSESSAPRRRQKDGASTKVEPYAPSAQSEALFCRCCSVVFLSSVVSSSLSLPCFVCTIISCAADKAAIALPAAVTSYPPAIAHIIVHDLTHNTMRLTAASCARLGRARTANGQGPGGVLNLSAQFTPRKGAL